MSSVLDVSQPPVEPERLAAAGKQLARYRFMAFLTGILLLTGTILIICKAAGVKHLEPGTGWVWIAHGWLYLVYVMVSGVLGQKLRWPLARYVLVMLAGTIPTASFIAEHFVTGAARRAATAQPVPSRD